MAPGAGTLFVVATPIGNLEDITARALRVLGAVALIAAEDTRRTSHLLARYAIQTPMTSLHEHNEARKTTQLLARLMRGESIALVSDAGTPTMSDPGSQLIRIAIDANIRVEAIPGPSAVIAAVAVSGLPTASFSFFGFPPTRSKDRTLWFERLLRVGGTVVFFEAPHRISATLTELEAAAGNCEISVARELTKAHEELVRGPIRDVRRRLTSPRGEFTVVANIGHITNVVQPALPGGRDLLHEFGVITKSSALNRRAAVAALARKYSTSVRDVYKAVETAKQSVE